MAALYMDFGGDLACVAVSADSLVSIGGRRQRSVIKLKLEILEFV